MEIKYEYGAMPCAGCNEICYYKTTILPGGFDGPERFRCPKCEKDLGGLRTSLGLSASSSDLVTKGGFIGRLGDADMENRDEDGGDHL
jgi:hypothetical protein